MDTPTAEPAPNNEIVPETEPVEGSVSIDSFFGVPIVVHGVILIFQFKPKLFERQIN